MYPNLEQLVAGIALLGIRVSGVIWLAPFFGSEAISPRVKVGLTVLVTALLCPVYAPADLVLSEGWLTRIVVSELLIGLLIGLSVRLVFEAAQFAGQMMGMQVGFSLVNLMDPNTQVDTPVLGLFAQTVVMLLFLQIGVQYWLLRALVNSFRYLPVGHPIASGEIASSMLHAAGGIWLVGVQIAAPVVTVTLLADLVLGFLGKASPQLPVLFLGLSVKSMAGLAILAASLKYWPGLFDRCFSTSIQQAERLLQLAH